MNKKSKFSYALSDEDADNFFAEVEKAEKLISQEKLSSQHGEEQFIYEATPYSLILDLLDQFLPAKGEVVYDLGSGFGRVVIFGALNSEAHFCGIEISELRNKKAEEMAKKLGLKNTQFITANVLDCDLSNGDVFFLFNPFFPETLQKVTEKLKDIARRKKIKIATWGGPSEDYFLTLDWLKRMDKFDPETPLEFFESKQLDSA